MKQHDKQSLFTNFRHDIKRYLETSVHKVILNNQHYAFKFWEINGGIRNNDETAIFCARICPHFYQKGRPFSD